MYIIMLMIILDQAAKYFFKRLLQPDSVISVINGILSFTYVENRGAAFGLFQGAKIFLIISTVILIVMLTYYYIKKVRHSGNKVLGYAFIFIIAGALGNLIDRLFRNYVIDFIRLDFIDFPIFNLADCYISIGAVILIIYILSAKKEEL